MRGTNPMRDSSLTYFLNSGVFLIKNFKAVSSRLSGKVVKNIFVSLPVGESSTRVIVRSDAGLDSSLTNSAARRCITSPIFSFFISRITCSEFIELLCSKNYCVKYVSGSNFYLGFNHSSEFGAFARGIGCDFRLLEFLGLAMTNFRFAPDNFDDSATLKLTRKYASAYDLLTFSGIEQLQHFRSADYFFYFNPRFSCQKKFFHLIRKFINNAEDKYSNAQTFCKEGCLWIYFSIKTEDNCFGCGQCQFDIVFIHATNT